MSLDKTIAPTRRCVLAAAAAGGAWAAAAPWSRADLTLEPLWRDFKARFVRPSGRVVDTFNDGISHSEGQGYAMIMATAAGDRRGFDRIWDWTEALLAREDGLFVWKWDPAAAPHVTDANNSSDGDLLIAWALLRGARRWGKKRYRRAGADILDSLERHAVASVAGAAVLLPAAAHFETADGVVLNPSYYVFPALAEAAEVGGPVWDGLYRDGLNLLRAARFGAHALPADWVFVARDGRIAPAEAWPARFGYEAIRAPLYLAWAGERDDLSRYEDAWGAASEGRGMPSFFDLQTGAVSSYDASVGFRAVRELTRFALELASAPAAGPLDEDYYAASLQILSLIAAREGLAQR